MAAPTPYDRQTGFALFSAQNPGEPHSGADLDTEFNAVKIALDETQSNLALIQDDDGRLARGSVGRAQLDSSITIGFESPAPWETDASYLAEVSTVFHEAIFYICVEDHTSGTFATDLAAGKWELIADLSASAAIADNSIVTAKYADLSVTAAKLASNSVSNTKIGSGAVTTSKLADEAVTSAKVDASVWSTGDVKLTLKATADAGWRMFDDGTIGDASSSSTYANAAAEDLFTLLFNNCVDANCAILTSAGGATTRVAQTDAATAWAAHCRMTLPKALGRNLALAGAGSGLTARTLGSKAGTSNTKPIAQANLPSYNLVASGLAVAGTITPVVGGETIGTTIFLGYKSDTAHAPGGSNILRSADSVALSFTHSLTAGGNVPSGGSGTEFDVTPASTYLNAMVKL